MPRPRKPARLYERPDTGEWIIRDGGKDRRTGFRGQSERASAEAAFGEYLTERGLERPAQKNEEASVIGLVDEYVIWRQDKVASPETMDYNLLALTTFWSDKTVADVTEQNCKAYLTHRQGSRKYREISQSTVRKELSMMSSALKHFSDRISKVPKVWLPEETEPSPDWLTRDEFAAVLWQLWRSKRSKHAARLAVCQFYTGSRPRTVYNSTWHKREKGPWIDLEHEIWHRRGKKEQRTKKERNPHRIPRRLLAHLKRWHRLNPEWIYVVEHPRHPGKPVGDIEKALTTACKKAGVKRIVPHGLKHTAITLFIQSGGSIEAASEYFSTSPETIRKTYWHHSPHHQKQIADQIGRMGR